MSTTNHAGIGLRARSKVRRRRLILHTALRLFAERGYDRTTIQDIADEAEVAPRTVTTYFSSKLDFVTEWPAIRSQRLIEFYEADPTIGFVELIDRWWHDARQAVDPEEAALTRAMALANPGIVAMAEAEVSRRIVDDGFALRDTTDVRAETLLQVAGRAAISGINRVFFQGIAEGRMNDESQASLLALLRVVAEQSGAGHGTLDLKR